MLGSHSNGYDMFYLLGYNAAKSVESQPTFRKTKQLLAVCSILLSCVTYSSGLHVEATCSSKTLVDF
jgi:hypothetical protein